MEEKRSVPVQVNSRGGRSGYNLKIMIKAGGEVKKECHPSTKYPTAEV